MTIQKVRIGTRGSKLALYQAYKVKETIEQKIPSCEVDIIIYKTKGDKILDVALSKIGDKGLFTKEIENALLNDEVDIAVHSLKDLPTSFVDGLILGAVLERGEFRDAFVSRNNVKLSELTSDSKIATSSLRRRAQLLSMNPDVEIIDIRGNVGTRLEKMDNGYCDGMIMAAAGLIRLGLGDRITEIIEPEIFVPAVSQGAIAIQIRDNDPASQKVCDSINHNLTWITTKAERLFLHKLEGGCQIPVGAWSEVNNESLIFTGYVSDINGVKVLKESLEGPVDEAELIAEKVADSLIEKGAGEIVKSIREQNSI